MTAKGNKLCVVLDGREGPKYDGIVKGSLHFSPSGEHLAYAATKGDEWFVVLDGKEGPKYDGIIPNGPTFQADGTLEYLAFKYSVLFRIKHSPAGQK